MVTTTTARASGVRAFLGLIGILITTVLGALGLLYAGFVLLVHEAVIGGYVKFLAIVAFIALVGSTLTFFQVWAKVAQEHRVGDGQKFIGFCACVIAGFASACLAIIGAQDYVVPAVGVPQGYVRVTEEGNVLSVGQTAPRTRWRVSSVLVPLAGDAGGTVSDSPNTRGLVDITVGANPEVKAYMRIRVLLAEGPALSRMIQRHAVDGVRSVSGRLWNDVTVQVRAQVARHLATVIREMSEQPRGSDIAAMVRLGALLNEDPPPFIREIKITSFQILEVTARVR
jgi:hypothetical protein